MSPQAREHQTLTRSPICYRNHLRWRVTPSAGATQHGFFDRSFPNRVEALKYQKRVKQRFPHQPCCLIDTGRWYTSTGRILR